MTNIPKNLKYTKEHEWIKLEGNIGTVGITDYAQTQLTDVVFVELPEKGKQVEKDKTLATLESVKSVSEVFSPLTGIVKEVNEKLADSPDKINKEPYGEGWIAKLEIKDKAELASLMDPEKYEKHIHA